MIDAIGLDGDDTLWHSERYFVDIESRLPELLGRYVEVDEPLTDRLVATERRNLRLFGYGAKAFTLSMIETAIEITEGRLVAEDVHRIISWGKELLSHPVELLDGVDEALDALGRDHRLILVTKGDLFHQEEKVASSGVADLFDAVEIVSEKDVPTYARVLARHDVEARRFCMVGNSVRSDVLPVLELGGQGVHVPYDVTWALELEPEASPETNGYHHLTSLRELPGLIAGLDAS